MRTVPEDLLAGALDAFPSPVFVLDSLLRIQASNQAARRLGVHHNASHPGDSAGEVLDCIHALEDASGCAHNPGCNKCLLRQTVRSVTRPGETRRQRVRVRIQQFEREREVLMILTVSPFLHRGKTAVLLVLEDVRDLGQASRHLPFCRHCKKLQNTQLDWDNLEGYFKRQWDIELAQGICPDCLKKQFPELMNVRDQAINAAWQRA